ncbi:hypothetical protein [Subtercola sp. YIM 133946]|uniref:hypothetical protein n=1 Tax=Subtercola sp. YIM 133946 TaxID=3118909 RepID=UPI002F941D59
MRRTLVLAVALLSATAAWAGMPALAATAHGATGAVETQPVVVSGQHATQSAALRPVWQGTITFTGHQHWDDVSDDGTTTGTYDSTERLTFVERYTLPPTGVPNGINGSAVSGTASEDDEISVPGACADPFEETAGVVVINPAASTPSSLAIDPSTGAATLRFPQFHGSDGLTQTVTSGDPCTTATQPAGFEIPSDDKLQTAVATGQLSPGGAALVGSQSLTGRTGWTGTWTWNLTGTCYDADADSAGCADPVAVIAPTAPVDRTASMTLDGSASTPGGNASSISSYQWSVAPGANCPPNLALKNTDHRSADPQWGPFPVLCDLQIGLIVTDDAGDVSAQVTSDVTVNPRTGSDFAHIVVGSTADPNGDSPDLEPLDPNVSFTAQDGAANVGQNFSTCPTRNTQPTLSGLYTSVLCPARTQNGVGTFAENDAYETAAVTSPGSPFDGFGYITGSKVTIPLTGVTNRTLGPNGTPPTGQPSVYDENEAGNAAQYNGFLTAVSEHENNGVSGLPHSGHSSAIQETIDANQKDDVNIYLESQIAPSQDAVTKTAEKALLAAENELATATADSPPTGNHLAYLGTYRVFWWESVADPTRASYPGYWAPYTCVVGGPDSNCTPTTDAELTIDPLGPHHPGQRVHITGGAFSPGESVSVDAHSTPEHLGDATASGDGTISLTVTIPADLAPGTHAITATAATSGLTSATEVTVAAGSASPVGPTNPVSSTGSDTATPPGETTGGDHALADTGSDAVGAVVVACALFIVGVLSRSIARRRSGRQP